MKIVVDSIESKLNEPFFVEFKGIVVSAIAKYIAAIKDFENSGAPRDLLSGSDNVAEMSINEHFIEITSGLDCSSPTYQILDALLTRQLNIRHIHGNTSI